MIKNLWSLCKFNTPGTSNAALNGLSKFDRSLFKCSFLPEIVKETKIEKIPIVNLNFTIRFKRN